MVNFNKLSLDKDTSVVARRWYSYNADLTTMVCVDVCVWIYIYIYIYICVCGCVTLNPIFLDEPLTYIQ